MKSLWPVGDCGILGELKYEVDLIACPAIQYLSLLGRQNEKKQQQQQLTVCFVKGKNA